MGTLIPHTNRSAVAKLRTNQLDGISRRRFLLTNIATTTMRFWIVPMTDIITSATVTTCNSFGVKNELRGENDVDAEKSVSGDKLFPCKLDILFFQPRQKDYNGPTKLIRQLDQSVTGFKTMPNSSIVCMRGLAEKKPVSMLLCEFAICVSHTNLFQLINDSANSNFQFENSSARYLYIHLQNHFERELHNEHIMRRFSRSI